MIKQNYLLILIFTIMFSFFEKVDAKYEKLFFDLNIKSINGDELNLNQLKGKTVLLVNVASKCGFTKQYSELQKLYDQYKEKGLVVIGIPSNQFGGQEPGSNEEIKNFCETNFNITFPMTDKVDVKGDNTHELYLWAKENFGKSTIPKWNFHKILINKEGKVQDTFGSFIAPLSKKIINKIELIL
jgi:glutathione peroxidase